VILLVPSAWSFSLRRSDPRRRLTTAPRRAVGDAALATLRLRYSRGEISEAEFEQMKRTLGG